VPLRSSIASMSMFPQKEEQLTLPAIRNTLCDLGYHEVVTYTFVDKKLQTLLDPGCDPKPLLNPITADMDVMRTNLWPGLVKTLIYNLNRQQNRIRLYETGLRFVHDQNTYLQERVISGLIAGSAEPEQWGVATRPVDFYDLKGDLQQLFKLTHDVTEFVFKPSSHFALHPGQTADIYRRDEKIGIIGALHPSVVQALDLAKNTFVFELKLDKLEPARLPRYVEVSKFPEIRRDIAIFVDRSVPVQAIQDTIIHVAGELLKEVNLFDVYQGKNDSEARKSLALSLTLQHSSRTLVDEEVADLMERVIVKLKESFAAELRG
jgi:phenylalanyl-tRNA synthetase beta chain